MLAPLHPIIAAVMRNNGSRESPGETPEELDLRLFSGTLKERFETGAPALPAGSFLPTSADKSPGGRPVPDVRDRGS
jgi:hypothetical protein